ncbi:hypothetical protein D3C84_277650 [compost metagenome]
MNQGYRTSDVPSGKRVLMLHYFLRGQEQNNHKHGARQHNNRDTFNKGPFYLVSGIFVINLMSP